jgi:polyhydroxyalkanoate synthesis regulator phasin
MATRKRASSRSKLLKRAVKAGRSALRNAEKRVPPDLRKQLERTIEDGQKTIHAAIKEVQVRLDRTARQADLDRAMKRLEGLSKQVRDLASSATSRATVGASPRKAARRTSARKPAARKPAVRKPATRKPAARKPATRKTTSATRPAARRPTTRSRSSVRSVPPPVPEVPERVEPSF